LYIETVYPLKGDIISTFVMDSFSLDDGGNFKGKIEPARLSFSMDKAFKKIGSSFTWKGCEVPGKLTITDIEFKTRMERISTQIWVGKTSFNLADFQAKDSGEQVDLKKMKMESDVNFDSQKNSLSASLGMGIGVLSRHGNDTLKDAFVRIGINQIGICFGASACYASPIGYQTNLLVYGPGGYRFIDYIKLGLPLNTLVILTSTWLIPKVWPF